MMRKLYERGHRHATRPRDGGSDSPHGGRRGS
jgi:hypothetical protein